MTHLQFGDSWAEVAEDVEEVLAKIATARDGLRAPNGTILAPAGWIHLTDTDTGGPVYVQVSQLGFVKS